jgi:hypothetical protein
MIIDLLKILFGVVARPVAQRAIETDVDENQVLSLAAEIVALLLGLGFCDVRVKFTKESVF